jgi:hypothetical protein
MSVAPTARDAANLCEARLTDELVVMRTATVITFGGTGTPRRPTWGGTLALNALDDRGTVASCSRLLGQMD